MKKMMVFVVSILMIMLFAGCASADTGINDMPEDVRVYECDYKSTSLFKTQITTTNADGDEINISGSFKLVTDPLTMTINEEQVAYAGDTYGLISQDSHGIYVNGSFVCNMVGEVNIFGDSYVIQDAEGNTIANMAFGATDTSGSLTSEDGTVIASYSSVVFMNDYTVKIVDNDLLSDEAILMLFASYVSDKEADNNKN